MDLRMGCRKKEPRNCTANAQRAIIPHVALPAGTAATATETQRAAEYCAKANATTRVGQPSWTIRA